MAVRLAGVCATDLEISRGYMGFTGILGHEFVGEVLACDDAAWVGQRVTAEINLACGTCSECKAGRNRHCPTRTVLGILGKDGCFAEQLTLPTENLHSVPAGVSDEAAVFTEPLAAAFEILEQIDVGADDTVLVLGDGRLGLLCALALQTSGASVTLAGRHPRKRAIVAARGVISVASEDLGNKRFDVVVEATGSPAGLRMATDHVRPRGRLVLKSTYQGAPELDTAKLVIDEITLVGSRCGPFPRALEALATGAVDPTPLIDARYALSDGLTAFARAGDRGVLKVLLEC